MQTGIRQKRFIKLGKTGVEVCLTLFFLADPLAKSWYVTIPVEFGPPGQMFPNERLSLPCIGDPMDSFWICLWWRQK